ncbi:ceramide transfer protein isoform X1 [Cloeon dipterum]|uniref:ceramide transfer protein isoform X1 n=1 Tax=Cloeon dipterum TaxID=197152 RepID=UPI00321F7588
MQDALITEERSTMAEDPSVVTFSDEDDEVENGIHSPPELQGVLNKWTNFFHGWQTRFIVLRDGTLSYYKSEQDTNFGCRGAISLFKATIKPHEFDECRFDVSVNDCVWYLRAENLEEKNHWVQTLETCKAECAYGSENSLRRHGSAISLASNTFSTASASSFKKGRGLKEKLAEIETFRDILCRQIETLQGYYDNCAETYAAVKILENGTVGGKNGDDINASEEPEHALLQLLHSQGLQAPDFKGEALTFKATTSGVLATLAHCLELVNQREEGWRKRLERETERRKRLEELYKHAKVEAEKKQKVVVRGGPDFEEGPHSALNDDEFYDAVESGLDKIDEEIEFRERLKLSRRPPSSKATEHKLWPEIDRVCLEQLHYARLNLGEGGWQLFAEDGEMRMYKREEEVGGMVVDPLKAVHIVKGVTGHEMCHYFFSADVRMDWETTVEQMTVLESIAEDTQVFLQIHKRVWPAAQRDSLFWSHIRKVPNIRDEDGQDFWIVCNHSTEHQDFPVSVANSGKCVRLFLTVCLVCQTFIDPPKDGTDITRDNLTCKITYCSVVNPGGWAPASVLRAVYKREYPKFLKRFTQYVIDQCADKPIMF